MKKATVAYEDPKAVGALAKYEKKVEHALHAMGASKPQELLAGSQAFVLGNFRGGVEPKHVASVIWHKHCEAGLTQPVPCVARETEAACPHDPPQKDAVAIVEAIRALIVTPAKEEAHDGGLACQPFTRLERDPTKLNACKARASGPLDTDKKMFKFLQKEMNTQDQEVFVVVGLDLHRNLRSYTEVARGQRDRVAVAVEDILRVVIADGPHGFCVAHNHPSGNARPSAKDKELTQKIKEASVTACPNVVFLDHLIIGSDNWFSFHDGLHKWL